MLPDEPPPPNAHSVSGGFQLGGHIPVLPLLGRQQNDAGTQNHLLGGTTIFWQSVVGEKYQVSSRLQFTNTAWANLGAPVTATNGQHFYRVSVLP